MRQDVPEVPKPWIYGVKKSRVGLASAAWHALSGLGRDHIHHYLGTDSDNNHLNSALTLPPHSHVHQKPIDFLLPHDLRLGARIQREREGLPQDSPLQETGVS